MLRIGIEARNLGSAGSVAYKSWGTIRPDSEPVILSDDEGNQLKLIDPAPLVPVGRPREFPAALPAKSRSIADVLLFEVPPAAARESERRSAGQPRDLPASRYSDSAAYCSSSA